MCTNNVKQAWQTILIGNLSTASLENKRTDEILNLVLETISQSFTGAPSAFNCFASYAMQHLEVFDMEKISTKRTSKKKIVEILEQLQTFINNYIDGEMKPLIAELKK